MPDLPWNHPWREFLISLVEIGGIVVIVAAAAIASLRKAFRFTDAFEGEGRPPRIPPGDRQ